MLKILLIFLRPAYLDGEPIPADTGNNASAESAEVGDVQQHPGRDPYCRSHADEGPIDHHQLLPRTHWYVIGVYWTLIPAR